jgi:hypothetical protein
MYAIQLGERVDPDFSKKIPLAGGGTLILSQNDQIFIVGLPDITLQEMDASQNKPINIGLLKNGDAIFFLLNIGNLIEFDFSYNYNVGPEEGRGISPIPYDQGYAFSLILFDTKDQIIKALRFFTVTPQFSEELHFMIEKSKERYQQGSYNFDYWFTKSMRQYPNPSFMWKDCVIKEKAGKSFKE